MAYEHVSLLNNKSKYLYSGGRSVDICPPKNIMSDKNLTSSLTYPENLKICDHGQHDHSNKASSSSDSKNPFYEVSNEYMRLSGYARQFTKLLQKNCKRKCENIEMPPPTIIDMTPEINDPDPDCQDLSKNVGSPYGILWKNPPNFKRIKRRKQLFLLKTKACYMAVLFSLIGLICAILEAELIANQYTTKRNIHDKSNI
uniref:Uncharacterized protein n=1 Tax=Romanomermis culicivorax TaxID=13658 RepID=A0A915HRM4_ROMCU